MSPYDLFAKYQNRAPYIARCFRRLLPVWVDVDDLHSAALLGIWRACQTWDADKAALTTHIKYCVRRQVIDMLRQWYGLLHYYRPQKPRLRAHYWPSMNGAIDHRRSPQQDYEDKEEVENALRWVYEPDRSIIRDYFLGGLKQVDIAHKYKMWPSDVSRLLSPYIERAKGTKNRRSAA